MVSRNRFLSPSMSGMVAETTFLFVNGISMGLGYVYYDMLKGFSAQNVYTFPSAAQTMRQDRIPHDSSREQGQTHATFRRCIQERSPLGSMRFPRDIGLRETRNWFVSGDQTASSSVDFWRIERESKSPSSLDFLRDITEFCWSVHLLDRTCLSNFDSRFPSMLRE
ncbi:hypothetical protein B0H34DRAFT_486213 [Crassisporium funariophilum]|nr:hypothetical protein B0H34DRAFT_486213 [Crassisporium funariophilum]